MADDYSQYTDEELMNIAGVNQQYSDYTDEELMSIAGIPQSPAAPQQKSFAQDQLTNLEALQGGVADAATFGFWDEGKAAIKAGLRSNIIGDVPYDQAYEHFLNKERETAKKLSEENPYAYGSGQVAGAVGSGLLFPTKGAAEFAARGLPQALATGAGIGAVSGGVYGFGSGEGGAEKRAENAVTSGIYGGAGGVAGAAVGKAVGPLTQKAINFLNRRKTSQVVNDALIQPSAPPVSAAALTPEQKIAAAPSVMSTTPPEAKQLATMSRTQGDIFSKTQGQKTQLPNAQRLESEALAGQYGDDAEQLARRALMQQSRERKQFLSKLGDLENAGNQNDVLEGVFDTLKSQSKRLKGEVNNAYDLAREGGGVKVSVDDIKDGLIVSIAKARREGQYDLNNLPLARSVASDLVKIVKSPKGGKITSANLSTMENWRKRVTNALVSTKDPTEKKLLGEMKSQYDDFMYRTANSAVDEGDKAAIMAFREAVEKRAEYGRMFEKDKFVKDVVTGKVGIDDAAKNLLGTGQLVGKKRMESTYDALLNAAGDDKKAVAADMQTAIAKKIFQQSVEGLEAGNPEAQFLSAAKMQKALEGLFIHNKNFATKLYGKDAVDESIKAIKELNVIKSSQTSTKNPSGSSEAFIRYLNKSKIFNLPVMNILTKSVEDSLVSGKVRQVEKSLRDVIGDIQIPPKSRIFGAIAGGQTAAKIPSATIYGDVNYEKE